jgi:hypothetical protein
MSLDRILAEIEAVDTSAVSELAQLLLARDALSAAAVGPREDRLAEAVEPVCPGLVAAAAA